MEIDNITSLATSLASAQTHDAVGIAVLKKAMDIGAANAEALIAGLPEIATITSNLPPHLGRNVNTIA
jgi:hypothetical protein